MARWVPIEASRGTVGRPGTAVVIEDHPILRATLADLLGSLDYAVRSASNGSTGLRLVQHAAPDLVVLDLVLPEMAGETVLAELRADRATGATPVLIVTGFPERLTSTGPRERLLPKPFTYEAFVEAVEALARADARAAVPA